MPQLHDSPRHMRSHPFLSSWREGGYSQTYLRSYGGLVGRGRNWARLAWLHRGIRPWPRWADYDWYMQRPGATIHTDGKRARCNRAETIYGGYDLQQHEGNLVRLPSSEGDYDESVSLGARTDTEAAQGNTWTMDIPQYTNTQCGCWDTGYSPEGGNSMRNWGTGGVKGSCIAGGRSLDDGGRGYIDKYVRTIHSPK